MSVLSLPEAIRFTKNLNSYNRRETRVVNIGDTPLGGSYPIRVQSMTTVDTMDTKGSVEQSIRMIEAGCEYVRITAPSIKEAENLRNIKKELRARGYNIPLVADIHFTPNAAELAARIVEKVRVNPGNYADKKRFEEIEYTDETYQLELERIREKFIPLVNICKEYGTAMRIGTNHGSLSDRIMSRYGDTPLGMVESALEFIRICEDLNYYDIVVSMKSSNPQVMVQAYRLLVQKLDEEKLQSYPLHLGVTEAGEAEDGRIKSAVGIGTLLEDGLGDTVRVSLTEEPEFEAPVAQMLVDKVAGREGTTDNCQVDYSKYQPFEYQKRQTQEVVNIGHDNVPRVIADLSMFDEIVPKDLNTVGHFYLPELDKWAMNDTGADFVYSGSNPIPFMLPNGLREIVDYPVWSGLKQKNTKYPLIGKEELAQGIELHPQLNFLLVDLSELDEELVGLVQKTENIVFVGRTIAPGAFAEFRKAMMKLMNEGCQVPFIIQRDYQALEGDQLTVYAATDIGGLLIDGFGDGVMITGSNSGAKESQLKAAKAYNQLAFGILQAARTRITKTEYISCPSCGRTLFDLQETTAMIRKRTDHLKGVKIGIMGCIVNGPGEMADADYGYVGSGKGKITLYKGKEVVKRGVPSKHALDELINLIKEDGKWIEPKQEEVATL
ncbi:MAG: (E)-4-hydroxy-3-methylbut-2-enyl-diphosphate synthase [Cyclobacteriaceae bacterium]|nr:(E)-4-hydroxy-3-methylbut-2-enyl-diphosphate synthase [Cyclobacteriaceae bacterium SS2]